MDEKYIFDTSFWIWMKNIDPMGHFSYCLEIVKGIKFATATL